MLVLLAVERIVLGRLHSRIPTCIAVVGTRGKSSVTRLIAFGLRGSGLRVAYKTTGSRAIYGDAEGTEHVVRRRGCPTPLEQRGILRHAARTRVDVLVVEALSVRPESLQAEVRRILRPAAVAVTNVEADHVADIDDPVCAFAATVPRTATAVLSPAAPTSLRDRLQAAGNAVRIADSTVESAAGDLPYEEWNENVALALAVCDTLGIPPEVARRGMTYAVPDRGVLAAWRISVGSATCVAVNAFAANDPLATQHAFRRARTQWMSPGDPAIGILNLRRDRGDRTAQWLAALHPDRWPFAQLVVSGHVPWQVRRSLRKSYGTRATFVPCAGAGRIMDELDTRALPNALLFGFGNFAGAGAALVDYWMTVGEVA